MGQAIRGPLVYWDAVAGVFVQEITPQAEIRMLLRAALYHGRGFLQLLGGVVKFRTRPRSQVSKAFSVRRRTHMANPVGLTPVDRSPSCPAISNA